MLCEGEELPDMQITIQNGETVINGFHKKHDGNSLLSTCEAILEAKKRKESAQ